MGFLDRFRKPRTLQESVAKFEQFTTQLEESGYSLTDLLLAMDTQGFERVGDPHGDMLDMLPPQREALIKRSRLYHQYEPLVDRPIDLWTGYAFGRGWTITPGKDAVGLQRVLDAIFEARHNRHLFTHFGWQVNSNSLLVDGERWFAFFTGKDGVRIRTFDPLEIKSVLSNPHDRDEIWYYRRTYVDLWGKVRTEFYRDWDYDGDDDHPWMSDQRMWAGWGTVDPVPQQGVYVSYLKVNTLGTRGYPMMTSSLDWVAEHREFMRDRAALQHARSRFAYKARVKGGRGDVGRIRSAFDRVDPTIPPERAGIAIENENLDLQQVTMDKDGASASNDARLLAQMGALASGIPDFLMGDTGNANLATATATERPLETMFTSYQELWIEYLRDMVYHVARWMGHTGDTTVVIDTPSIFERNPADTARGLADIINSVPAIGRAPQVVSMLLTAFGVEDVDAAMDIITPLLEGGADDGLEEAIRQIKERRAA